jgi:hypothetical protein
VHCRESWGDRGNEIEEPTSAKSAKSAAGFCGCYSLPQKPRSLKSCYLGLSRNSAKRLLRAAPEGRKDSSRGRKPPVDVKNRKSPGRGERLLFA